MSFDGANIQQFPDIPAVSAEILALRGWERDKERQKEYVREVMFELEAGPRQMSRVSGLSYGIIQHIKKGSWGQVV